MAKQNNKITNYSFPASKKQNYDSFSEKLHFSNSFCCSAKPQDTPIDEGVKGDPARRFKLLAANSFFKIMVEKEIDSYWNSSPPKAIVGLDGKKLMPTSSKHIVLLPYS